MRPPAVALSLRRQRRADAAVQAALTALAIAGGATACGRSGGIASGGADPGGLPLTMMLAGTDSDGFARATGPTTFSFPRDHGPHSSFRSEWWYFTGILAGGDSAGRVRRFGYQFTVFRQALAARLPPRDSAWATRDLFMGHLALSDLDAANGAGKRFHAFQRFARDGLGLAGAQPQPPQGWQLSQAWRRWQVWVDSWRMSGAEQSAGGDIFPVRLRAREAGAAGAAGATNDARVPADVAIDLSVSAGRGPVPEGDSGFSVKGAGAGSASYYYSCTRLPTRGVVTVGQDTFSVSGSSWLDREWSTSALDHDVVGWDWMGVNLDDGRDLVVYRLRSVDGEGRDRAAPASLATIIDANGGTHRFGPEAFSFTPIGEWTSADRAVRYPAAFHLTIPGEALDLVVEPLLADQELLLAVRYWEGAVAVRGRGPAGRPLTGSGYLELTGYGGAPTAQRPRR